MTSMGRIAVGSRGTEVNFQSHGRGRSVGEEGGVVSIATGRGTIRVGEIRERMLRQEEMRIDAKRNGERDAGGERNLSKGTMRRWLRAASPGIRGSRRSTRAKLWHHNMSREQKNPVIQDGGGTRQCHGRGDA